MMEEMRETNTAIMTAVLVVMVVVVFITWNWIGLQKKGLRIKAIQGCAEAAAQANMDGGFNGAVYKICVEDKGYETKIK